MLTKRRAGWKRSKFYEEIFFVVGKPAKPFLPTKILVWNEVYAPLAYRSDISWVFGTFMYHCNAAGVEHNPWEKLAPVSLQWGNDPNYSSKDYTNGEKLCQTWTNEELLSLSELKKKTKKKHKPSVGIIAKISIDIFSLSGTSESQIKMWSGSRFFLPRLPSAPAAKPESRPYWGFHGRANGPADHFKSCCASCHSTASFPIGKSLKDGVKNVLTRDCLKSLGFSSTIY